MIKNSILIVDDDKSIRALVSACLREEGYKLILTPSGEEAICLVEEESPILVILDILLPGADGFEVCRSIRTFSDIPIIMLTGVEGEEIEVRCFEAGADDYITKPFNVDTFIARVRAVLKRTKLLEETSPALSLGRLVIDFKRHEVILGDTEVILSRTEYHLLCYLARNAGRVLTNDQYLEMVWGEEYFGEHHLLQVNVSRLRQKIEEDIHNPKYIITRPGIGYMFLKPHLPVSQ